MERGHRPAVSPPRRTAVRTVRMSHRPLQPGRCRLRCSRCRRDTGHFSPTFRCPMLQTGRTAGQKSPFPMRLSEHRSAAKDADPKEWPVAALLLVLRRPDSGTGRLRQRATKQEIETCSSQYFRTVFGLNWSQVGRYWAGVLCSVGFRLKLPRGPGVRACGDRWLR